MTRLTPLETAVLDALADELRVEFPDLPGQIAESLVGVRRNTGAGFFTEVIVDRSRPPSGSALTGRFGSIHGDVPGLIEPMAFQIEVAGGRLMGLHGSTYGEPTDRIDFLVSPVSGLFRIDDQGESIPWTPRVLTEESPLRALQTWSEPYDTRPEPMTPEQRLVSPVLDAVFGKRDDPAKAPVPAQELPPDAVLVAGAVVVFGFLAVLAVILFRLPIFAALVLVGYGASLFRRPKAREVLRKVVAAIRAEGRT